MGVQLGDEGHDMISKKEKVERCYLEAFLRLLGKVPDDVPRGEHCDLVAVFPQQKIGVEVTEFHGDFKGKKGSQWRAVMENWRYLQRMIMEKVRQYDELKETSGLLFSERRELPPRKQYQGFVDELVQLSRERINSDCQERTLGSDYPLLHKHLKKFILKKSGCYSTWKWNHEASSFGVRETPLIQAAEPKVRKLIKYKQEDVEEVWLLVVSGFQLFQALGINLSSKLRTFDRLNKLLTTSGFNRVYLYQYMFDVAYEWPGWAKIGRESFA